MTTDSWYTGEGAENNMEKSRKEIAYDYIKPKIIFCELKPGDILDEKKIIEELGFSRTPIREAISELAEEKLVTIMPRRGIVVTQISLKDVEDMLNARALLEPYIFQAAFPNVEKDALLEMKHKLEEMIAHKKVKMDSLEEDFDYSFHMYFAQKANNQYLYRMMHLLMTHSQRIRCFSTMHEERYIDSYKEHIEIIDEILSGDEEKVMEVVRKHISNTVEGYKQIYSIQRNFFGI